MSLEGILVSVDAALILAARVGLPIVLLFAIGYASERLSRARSTDCGTGLTRGLRE
jgi:hypothetical protein